MRVRVVGARRAGGALGLALERVGWTVEPPLGRGDDPRFEQLFAWKHEQNAFGSSYMWVAADGNKIVGLRAFMRWEFVRGGEVLRAVRLSMTTGFSGCGVISLSSGPSIRKTCTFMTDLVGGAGDVLAGLGPT